MDSYLRCLTPVALRFTRLDTGEGHMTNECFNCKEPKEEGKVFCAECEQKDRKEMFPNGLRKEQENFYDKV